MCACVRVCACVSHSLCVLCKDCKCKRSMGEMVAVSTQQVSAQVHVSCNKYCNGDMQVY